MLFKDKVVVIIGGVGINGLGYVIVCLMVG